MYIINGTVCKVLFIRDKPVLLQKNIRFLGILLLDMFSGREAMSWQSVLQWSSALSLEQRFL